MNGEQITAISTGVVTGLGTLFGFIKKLYPQIRDRNQYKDDIKETKVLVENHLKHHEEQLEPEIREIRASVDYIRGQVSKL